MKDHFLILLILAFAGINRYSLLDAATRSSGYYDSQQAIAWNETRDTVDDCVIRW